MKSLVSKLRDKPFVLMTIITAVSIIVTGWNILTVIWIDREVADLIFHTEEEAELEATLIFLYQQEQAGQRYLLTGALEPLIQHKQFETLADFHLDQAHRSLSSQEDLALITAIRDDRNAYEAVFAQTVEDYQNGNVEEAIRLSIEKAEAPVKRARQQLENFIIKVKQEQEPKVGATDRLAWVSLAISLIPLVVFVGIASIALSINNRVLKFIVLFAILISLIVVGWNLYNIWGLKGKVNDVVTHLKELDQVGQTEIFLLAQEMAELDYVLSGNETHNNLHTELERRTDEHWNGLLSLQITAAERELLNALKPDYNTYEQTFEAIVSAYQQGNRAEAIRLSVEQASVSLDDVQKRVGEFVNRTELQMEAELHQVDRLTTMALTMGVFTIVILMMETIISTTVTVEVQFQQLRIEIDEAKRQEQVSEIVDSDFFRDLQTKAHSIRSRRSGPASAEDTPTTDE